jgi:hypothetical protein
MVALVLSTVSAKVNDSGKPGGIPSKPNELQKNKIIQTIPDDDQFIHRGKRYSSNQSSLSDKEQSQKPRIYKSTSTWQRLEALSESERQNAMIQFEPTSQIQATEMNELRQLETMWNGGNFEETILELKKFEDTRNGANIAIGISWKTPVEVQIPEVNPNGTDVRIGTDTNIKNIILDYHEGSGNLFTVILFYDTAATADAWTVNLSDDGGATWTETYEFSTSYTMNDVGAAVITDTLYVGYIGGADQYEARSRRFSALTGMVDNGYFYQTVFDKSIEINDVAFTSNVDWLDNRIYYLAILDDNSLVYYWDDQSGISWDEIATNITDANVGLDAHTNQDYTSYFLVASYITTSNRLYVARRGGSWVTTDMDTASISEDATSIAAYQDRMVTVFEDINGDFKYWISYDEGASWYFGYIAQDMNLFSPHVAGRHGDGFRVIYQQEVGEPDSLWTRHRDYGTGPGTASWGDPVYINETADVHTGTYTNVEWIPSATTNWGATWIAGPSPTTAWFDFVEPPVGIGDPYSGNFPDEFNLDQNYPNPFNPSTTIEFYIQQKSDVTLDVYNNLGQRVRRLIEGTSFTPGLHYVEWDGKTEFGEFAPSGIYFYKMNTDDFQQIRKMLLLK